MLTKNQIKECIQWIEDNPIDFELLQSIVSENSNTIQHVIKKYSEKYNKKPLTTPMTELLFEYIYQLFKTHPNSFHRYNINIKDGIVYSDKKGEINISEFVQKMMTENEALKNEMENVRDENNEIKHNIATLVVELEKSTTDLMVANEIIRKLKNREENLQVEKSSPPKFTPKVSKHEFQQYQLWQTGGHVCRPSWFMTDNTKADDIMFHYDEVEEYYNNVQSENCLNDN